MTVAISKDGTLDYCRVPPFHPPELFPEYPFVDVCPGNQVYPAVRQLLFRMGLDREHYGQPSWNPLGGIIKPGDHVFVKPNLVGHQNLVGGIECIIAQGSVIRAIADYACIALKGQGKLAIGDSPQLTADFDEVVRATGLGQIAYYYGQHGMSVDILNLMRVRGRVRKIGGIARKSLPGDPMGYRVVDLKDASEHYEIEGDSSMFRSGDYDRRETSRHHSPGKHEYCISASILDADVVISVPKLKTHAKSGISCALKNLIGISGAKDWLPHHRAGPAEAGGDEFERRDLRKEAFARLKEEIASTNSLLRIVPMRAASVALIMSHENVVQFHDPYMLGGWHGNHTIPRTIVDMNKILSYADRDGIMRDAPQRRQFILVDGIIAGEKEGPMSPSPHRCGVLAAGDSPVEVDVACSALMGFDYRKIHQIRYAMGSRRFKLFEGRVEDIKVVSDKCGRIDDVYDAYNCALEPPSSWKGHIEYKLQPAVEKVVEKPVVATMATW